MEELKHEYDSWFEEFKKTDEFKKLEKNPVAYFCSEYALETCLPTYAGGLGILSGDHIREASMRDFPLIAVGLLYQKSQNCTTTDVHKNPKLSLLKGESGETVVVNLPFEGRNVSARTWVWQEGKTKVYLLDTDFDQNDPKDREITKELYVEDRDLRLKQEILLGIGGFRLVAKIARHASVYHMNEGHSAFLALELVRHEIEHQRVDFLNACDFAKKHLIFTNHTVVPAGQEHFDPKRVVELVEHCARDICLNIWEIGTLGTMGIDPNVYSMTTMSFRLSSASNSVSKIHLEKAKSVWPEHAKTMTNITNGIYLPRWDQVASDNVEEIIKKHSANKRKMLEVIKKETGQDWGDNDLVFVWARRMVSYKQPLLILDDIEKIKQMIDSSPVKIRFVFAGPTNHSQNPFIEQIQKIASEKLAGSLVYLSGYNIDLAQTLCAGADVWLNTPVIGNEACGTSGMKAGLNGALNLSTRDGWVAEVRAEEIGWIVDDCQSCGELYKTIEEEIIPLYKKHVDDGAKSEWSKKMQIARETVIKKFSTSRMLKEYIEKMYLPTLAQKHKHEID